MHVQHCTYRICTSSLRNAILYPFTIIPYAVWNTGFTSKGKGSADIRGKNSAMDSSAHTSPSIYCFLPAPTASAFSLSTLWLISYQLLISCPWPLTYPYLTRREAVLLERPHKRSYEGYVHSLNILYIISPSPFSYAYLRIPWSLLNPIIYLIPLYLPSISLMSHPYPQHGLSALDLARIGPTKELLKKAAEPPVVLEVPYVRTFLSHLLCNLYSASFVSICSPDVPYPVHWHEALRVGDHKPLMNLRSLSVVHLFY